MNTNEKQEQKLTKAEMKEIEKLISYYSSLDLDMINQTEKVDFPNSERDTLNGLKKLVDFYNSK